MALAAGDAEGKGWCLLCWPAVCFLGTATAMGEETIQMEGSIGEEEQETTRAEPSRAGARDRQG